MKKINVREFRKSLSSYLLGEPIIITRNGKEIGRYYPKFKLVENKL